MLAPICAGFARQNLSAVPLKFPEPALIPVLSTPLTLSAALGLFTGLPTSPLY